MMLVAAEILGQRLGQRVDRPAVLPASSIDSLTDSFFSPSTLTTTTASDRLTMAVVLVLAPLDRDAVALDLEESGSCPSSRRAISSKLACAVS